MEFFLLPNDTLIISIKVYLKGERTEDDLHIRNNSYYLMGDKWDDGDFFKTILTTPTSPPTLHSNLTLAL